jgi:hypothetical protein
MELKKWKDVISDPDIDVIKIHTCSRNKKKTAGLLMCQFEDTREPVWMLVNVWIAGEEEVQDGEADYSGEILSTSMIAVNYCPFCGKTLTV